ncbi:MAG: radical SAM protein [Deltaproteobacteria bacterium]|nr:radical SAM protein [Deltaproteobacteria bacterium]MBW2069884.1 radical SAM protein [Deltaproteobacteria bacterium]
MIEQGPIRPPSESKSLFLRLTRNCPWNRCLFCPVYKGTQFSRRSTADIKKEIDTLRQVVEEIQEISWKLGFGGKISSAVMTRLQVAKNYHYLYRQVAIWLYHGEGTVFLQDANSLILKPQVLAEILRYLRTQIPGIRRVTSYARSSTLARRTLADLQMLKEAGLDRIHIGLESGYDPVLRFMKKGCTAAEHIEAGRMVRQAGITLSEYVMPGLGGKTWWREHAVATGEVLNQINPDYIRLRSLRVPKTTPLYQKVEAAELELLDDDAVVREIRLFIETLDGITSTITSDHIMNLLEEICGTMPVDKEKMLAVADRYLALPEEERLLFKVGRWGGAYRSLNDLEDHTLRAKIEQAIRQWNLDEPEQVNLFIKEMADQYI